MRVLVVGVATLDIVFDLPAWPTEDSERRAQALRQARGGNAANSAVVLALRGASRVDWLGTLADDAGAALIRADLDAHRVGHAHAPRLDDGVTPTSCVWLNRSSGSRTIVHYRKLRELEAEDLGAVSLADYDWVHFEGRNPPALGSMMRAARLAGARVSLETEKARDGIEALWPLADVLLFSRHYARQRGFDSALALLHHVATRAPAAESYCAWGKQGAAWRGADGRSCFVAAPRIRCVDSLGAGDVFNALVIEGLCAGRAPVETLIEACRVATRSCEHSGFEGVTGD